MLLPSFTSVCEPLMRRLPNYLLTSSRNRSSKSLQCWRTTWKISSCATSNTAIQRSLVYVVSVPIANEPIFANPGKLVFTSQPSPALLLRWSPLPPTVAAVHLDLVPSFFNMDKIKWIGAAWEPFGQLVAWLVKVQEQRPWWSAARCCAKVNFGGLVNTCTWKG